MMLLGIVLHVFNFYIDFPVQRVPDAQTSSVFDFGYLFLHLFRMPVFFLISGFFTALLLDRRGTRSFIENRAGRTVVPFVLSWLPLFTLTWWSAAFALRQAHATFNKSATSFNLGRFVRDDGLVHLWFLYYLIIFYVFALVAWPIVRRLPARVADFARTSFRRLAPSSLACLLLALLTFPGLLGMRRGVLATSLSFIPQPPVIYVYGLFFAFGAALYGQRDLLPVFARSAWTRLALGLAIVPVNFLAVRAQAYPLAPSMSVKLLAAATGSIIAWFMTYGLLGLFIRYANTPNRYARYLTDASYWIYLIHLPLVNFLGGVLAQSNLPLWLKPLSTLVIATPLLLLSYHFFVRSTIIGKILNGRRYSRNLPEIELRSAQATA